MIYKLYKTIDGKDAVIRMDSDVSMTSFLFDENNPDYQAYLKWVSEGNTAQPADE
jgi:hypothetical protein